MDWKDTMSQESPPQEPPLEKQISRRKFLRAAGNMVLGGALVSIGGMAYATKIEPGWVEIVPVELALPHLDPAFDGFRLAQISDIHISRALTGTAVAEAAQITLDLKPDLVALTGDFVDERKLLTRLAAELSDALRPLVSQVQSIAVLGNHDYHVGPLATRDMLARLGIQELNNQVLSLKRDGKSFHFAGVDDIWNGSPRLSRVTAMLPEEGAAVLLAHEPDYADISAAVGRFDLQISGHTHGGQVVLPWVGPPMLPYLGEKYPAGLYRVNHMFQYTNRGLGMTAPYLRFNCRPEITLFTFRAAESTPPSSETA